MVTRLDRHTMLRNQHHAEGGSWSPILGSKSDEAFGHLGERMERTRHWAEESLCWFNRGRRHRRFVGAETPSRRSEPDIRNDSQRAIGRRNRTDRGTVEDDHFIVDSVGSGRKKQSVRLGSSTWQSTSRDPSFSGQLLWGRPVLDPHAGKYGELTPSRQRGGGGGHSSALPTLRSKPRRNLENGGDRT